MWQEQKSIFLFSIYAVEHMTKCHQEATGGNTNAKQREQTLRRGWYTMKESGPEDKEREGYEVSGCLNIAALQRQSFQ